MNLSFNVLFYFFVLQFFLNFRYYQDINITLFNIFSTRIRTKYPYFLRGKFFFDELFQLKQRCKITRSLVESEFFSISVSDKSIKGRSFLFYNHSFFKQYLYMLPYRCRSKFNFSTYFPNKMNLCWFFK